MDGDLQGLALLYLDNNKISGKVYESKGLVGEGVLLWSSQTDLIEELKTPKIVDSSIKVVYRDNNLGCFIPCAAITEGFSDCDFYQECLGSVLNVDDKDSLLSAMAKDYLFYHWHNKYFKEPSGGSHLAMFSQEKISVLDKLVKDSYKEDILLNQFTVEVANRVFGDLYPEIQKLLLYSSLGMDENIEVYKEYSEALLTEDFEKAEELKNKL